MAENEQVRQTLPLWRQLRWTLIVYFVLLAALPVISAVTITLSREIQQTRNQVIQQLEAIAQLKQDQIIRRLDDAVFILNLFLAEPARKSRYVSFVERTLSTDAVFDLAEQDRLNKLLEQAAAAQPVFDELFLYNLKGEVIAASNPVQIGKIVTAQPYFKSSLTKENFIQTPYYQLGSDELAMFLTHALSDEQTGATVGVLAAQFDLDIFGNIMLERTGLGESGETYLVSPINNYFLTPSRFEEEGYVRNRAYHSEGIDRALGGEKGAGVYDDYRNPSQPVFGVYRWLPEMQVALLAEVDEAEALASSTASRNLTIVFTGGAILIAIIVGLVSAGRISRPIAKLTQAATSIAAGNLDQRAEVKQANEIGLLAISFNSMTAQLQTLIGSLEERVAARTRRLEIMAALSERLSAILSQEQLLAEVVQATKDNFGYYHAHIYLLDDKQEKLVVAAGTGEAGAELKARGHNIPLDAHTSLVARAARTGEVISVDNVREAEDWLPNPFLPNTYSEMAVPIVLAGQVVGVLDVQEDNIGGLDESDASLLRTLANQVAVAIRNARLFEEVESALAEARAAQARYLEQSWQQVRGRQVGGQYHYARPEAPPLSESAVEVGRQQALAHNNLALVTLAEEGSVSPVIVAPIKVADQPIGALQLHPLRADQSWSEDDLAVVEAVIDELGQAAESLRLFEETRERASREQAIREITDKLRAAPSLNALLEIASRELGQRLGVPHTVLELGIDSSTELAGPKNGQQ